MASGFLKTDKELLLKPLITMCLDFVNTLAYRGSSKTESLHTLADLIQWCSNAGAASARLAEKIRAWSERHPKRGSEIFGDAIVLREAIYRIFHAVVGDANPGTADLELLNRALSDAPSRVTLQRATGGFGWQVEEDKPSAAVMLAPVLWSAGDLLVGLQLARVRECSNEKCLWLFLDDSKNGTRRWCSMQACGNRAKAHRHYLRQKRT